MDKNPLSDILIRTCTDKSFREEFLRDAAGVLRRSGIQVPEGVSVKVIENSDERIHVVLPTSLTDQPANWARDERPKPGEEVEKGGLLIQWTEGGISLIGRINSENAPVLKQELNRVKGNLYVDFKQVTYMSSAGLGVLLATQKRLTSDKKELFLCDVAAPIRNIFSLSGLDSLFQFVSTDVANNWWMAFPPA
jgi:anti-sigma B factor antagonist